MHSQKSSKQWQISSKQKALILTRNECLLENLVSTNKSSKQKMESSKKIMESCKQIMESSKKIINI
jgi:hypothetical protein